MCGIVGFCNTENVSEKIYAALKKLEHRGNDSSGIATFEKRFFIYKKSGKPQDVFSSEILKNLKGNSGIGHVRYSTQGKNTDDEAQPFFISYPFGISMVHNGNVTNRREIQKRLENNFFSIKKTNDIELILFTFADELRKLNLSVIDHNDVFGALKRTQKILKGAYSVISLIGNMGMLAFKDKFGIRPLVFGKKREKNNSVSYAFASETVALTSLGYEIIRELEPDEAIFIDKKGNVYSKILGDKREKRLCIFEYIYFAKPESVIDNRNVAEEREKYGRLIAEMLKGELDDADFITEIPQTAYFSATSLSMALNIPYKKVIIKNSFSKRSFIQNSTEKRAKILEEKFSVISEFIKGKNIIVVDDSIVRGTTVKHIVKLMKNAHVKKIYMVSTSPMIKYPCVYGIDMSITKELIAYKRNIKEVEKLLGVDKLFYPELSMLKELYKDDYGFCDACFSGNYPTKVTSDEIKYLEEERIKVKYNNNLTKM